MKFGDYIRQKREQKSWSQPEASTKIDIEQSYLSKLETGKSYPSEDIFNRLMKAYEISLDEMSKHVFSDELNKLKEIKEMRTHILERQKHKLIYTRSWMIAGLAFLMLSGISIGTALINEVNEQEFYYRSEGVLLPGEKLTSFRIIKRELMPRTDNDPKFKVLRVNQNAMIERIDQDDLITKTYRGKSYIEDVPNGKRFYELFDNREAPQQSFKRWFIIPGLMFLFGSFGCFFISLRWS